MRYDKQIKVIFYDIKDFKENWSRLWTIFNAFTLEILKNYLLEWIIPNPTWQSIFPLLLHPVYFPRYFIYRTFRLLKPVKCISKLWQDNGFKKPWFFFRWDNLQKKIDALFSGRLFSKMAKKVHFWISDIIENKLCMVQKWQKLQIQDLFKVGRISAAGQLVQPELC